MPIATPTPLLVNPQRRRFAATCLAALPLPAWAQSGAAGAKPLTIAAAASVQPALQEILAQFQQKTGQSTRVIYGASGNLTRQIQQGLPAEVFLSADEDFAKRLAQAGLTESGVAAPGVTASEPAGVVYAVGRLALQVAPGVPIALDAELRGLRTDFANVRKFAIANPEIAPFGRAAREALQHIGLWQQVQAKLVLGESVAQATQFVATGAAQAGLTALSLLIGTEAKLVGTHIAVAPTMHQPLRQSMVLLRGAGAQAQALFAYLQKPEARAVFSKHGFD